MIAKPLKIFNASAGSGKTYTLVKEYLRLVLKSEHPKKFSSILAMTFTNKAANEMKERILQKLIQLAKAPADRTTDDVNELQSFSKDLNIPADKLSARAHHVLNSILHHYGMFSVMTIDKFTHKVIRTFAKELGLSLDFDVELDLATLRKNIADMLFDQIGRDEEVTQLMINYADSNLEEDKSWNFKRSLIDFSQQLFKEDAIQSIQQLKSLKPQDFLDARKKVLADRLMFENTIKKIAIDTLELISSNGLDQDDFVGKSRGGVVPFFEKAARGEFEKNEPSKTLSTNIQNDKWVHPKSSDPATAESLVPSISKAFWEIDRLMKEEYPRYILNSELLKNINNLSLMNHLMQMTETLKEQENILLISDFYQKIADVIVNEPVPFIYERLGVRYEHFLLDEFQDTSHLQWINLVPLIHNSLAANKENLIVGDGKQAIYRWRNGEVEQFISLPEKIYNPEGIASLTDAQSTFMSAGKNIPLEHNFRSAKEIVEFNNDYFQWITQDKAPIIESIYKGGSQQVVKTHKGYVELFLPEDKDRQIQLKYVLETVNKSLSLGYKQKDICVLVRRNQEGSDAARYLNEAGIKVVSQESLFVSKDHTVKFVYNLIRSLAHPTNKNYKKKCVEHYDVIFKQENHLFDLLDQDFHIKDWLAKEGYSDLQLHTGFHSFYEYVEHLIAIFNFDLNENIYLQFFLEQVHNFEKRHSNNIHSFIEWFEESGYKESVKNPEGADAVNIMTIHKAKGLQFPVVICLYFDWGPKKNATEKWVSDEQMPIQAFPLKPSKKTTLTAHGEVMTEELTKQELDHLNLIYVSFTRPETALFIAGSTTKRSSFIAKDVQPYLEQKVSEGLMLKQEEKYCAGSFVYDEGESESPDLLETVFMDQVLDKPTLSTSSGDRWDINDMDASRAYGTQLHLVLSEIKSAEDTTAVVNRLFDKGKIEEKNIDSIQANLKRLFKNEQFNAYFSAEVVMNEKPIIDMESKKHIPDKIIEMGDAFKVIDFKTGEEKTSKHKKQLKTYVDLVSTITQKEVLGELFYTKDEEVIPL